MGKPSPSSLTYLQTTFDFRCNFQRIKVRLSSDHRKKIVSSRCPTLGTMKIIPLPDQHTHTSPTLQHPTEPVEPTVTKVPKHGTRQRAAETRATNLSQDAHYVNLQQEIREAVAMRAKHPSCGSLYWKPQAGPGSTQVNGPYIRGNMVVASSLADFVHSDGHVMHVRPEKRGSGIQINGGYFSLAGVPPGEEHASIPSPPTTWVQPVCHGGPQINQIVVDTLDCKSSNV